MSPCQSLPQTLLLSSDVEFLQGYMALHRLTPASWEGQLPALGPLTTMSKKTPDLVTESMPGAPPSSYTRRVAPSNAVPTVRVKDGSLVRPSTWLWPHTGNGGSGFEAGLLLQNPCLPTMAFPLGLCLCRPLLWAPRPVAVPQMSVPPLHCGPHGLHSNVSQASCCSRL